MFKRGKAIFSIVLVAALLVILSMGDIKSHAACNCKACQILNKYAMGETTSLIQMLNSNIYDAPVSEGESASIVSRTESLDTLFEGCTAINSDDETNTDSSSPTEQSTVDISVLTQNIRVKSDADGEDNTLEKRYERLKSIFNTYDADITCLQECSVDWHDKMNAAFPEDKYDRVYMETNVGHRNPIYIKKSVCKVLDKGGFYVSEINENDYNENRVASWALVEKKGSGKTLLMINTHLPVAGSVQNPACEKIRNFINTISADAVLVCGDFNYTPTANATAYRTMTSDGMKDIEIAAISEGIVGSTGGTFHNYGKKANPIRIDYFFGGGAILAKEYSVVKDMFDGLYASDHYGVYSKVGIK